MSDYDFQFREIWNKRTSYDSFENVRICLVEIAIQERRNPADIITLWNEWFIANAKELLG